MGNIANIDSATRARGRVERFLGNTRCVGPAHMGHHRYCVECIRETKPLVAWVDKGVGGWLAAPREARRTGAHLVHHLTDAMGPRDAATRQR